MLGRKGCSRTALEYCKLVLSFWPEGDPYGIMLLLDYYAVRAREYQFFIDFVSGWFADEFYKAKVERCNTLLLMPNLLYSCALCKKMLNLSEVPKEAQLTEDFAKVLSVRDINEVVKLGENALLIMAIIMYPSLLKRIINKVKSPGSTSWNSLLESLKLIKKSSTDSKKYYARYDWLCADKKADCAKSSLNKIYAIYEEKAANCFSSEGVQNWIRTVTNFLCENLKQGELQPELVRDSIISSGACPFYLDRYSHLNVLDFKDDLTTIPQEQLNPMIENTLFAPQQAGAPQPAAGGPPNPLTLFFRTLFS